MKSISKSGLFALLSAREQTSDGIISGWGDTVNAESGSHHIIDLLQSQGTSLISDELVEKAQGSYTCSRANVDAGVGFAQGAYYERLRTIVDAQPAGEDALAKRPAFILASAYGAGALRVWLDARSLFPVRFEVPALNSAASGEQLQPAMTIDILALNPVAAVARPTSACK